MFIANQICFEKWMKSNENRLSPLKVYNWSFGQFKFAQNLQKPRKIEELDKTKKFFVLSNYCAFPLPLDTLENRINFKLSN
jgi:hypothetical protein